MSVLKPAVLAAISLVSLATLAGTAPWYQWKSKLDGNLICAQTSPGDGWLQNRGPFKDARCRIPGTPD